MTRSSGLRQALKKNQVWIGGSIVILSASVLVCVHLWMSSRSFVALNTRISLARGNAKVGPFKINLRTYYYVQIDTGWQYYFDPSCPSYNNVRVRWMLYKDGAAYLKWIDASSTYTDLGDFLGEQGTYELHLEVLSDTACLNPGRPRLIVYANRDEWDDWASPLLWISAFGLALGLSLISLALLTAKLELQDTRISDLASIAQSFQWAQKLPLGRQSSSLPAFALFAVPGLVILIVIFMFFEGMRPSTKGIYIHLLKPGHVAGDDESIVGNTPVVVRVADAGPGLTPRLYVNSTLTSWDKLADVLRDQLKLRPKWVIYVEADPNVTWTSAVNVMDVAKGLQARVVLLTGNQSPYPHAEQKKGRSQE